MPMPPRPGHHHEFHGNYGAPFGLSLKLPWWRREFSVFRTNRKRLNAVAIMVCIFLPWALFCLVYALSSFTIRYRHETFCWIVIAMLFLVFVGSTGFLALVQGIRRRKLTEEELASEYEPMWYTFLCATVTLAIVSATILGSTNFDTYMQKYYDIENLATYKDIDPSQFVGQQLVDAGRVIFKEMTYVDTTKSMAFKKTDLYCVAPIVMAKANATYTDFWAVGTNCCSGNQADFHCNGYLDLNTRGGIRLMSDNERPFYRLAVQQAEATYKLHTRKPLFFHFGPNPIEWSDDLQKNGHTNCYNSIFAALCVQCFLVAAATLVVAKWLPSR